MDAVMVMVSGHGQAKKSDFEEVHSGILTTS